MRKAVMRQTEMGQTGMRETANPAQALRCVLVEDQLMFLQLLAGMLRLQPGLEVAATATSAAEGVAACRRLRPDLLILDLCLPDQPGEVVAQTLATLNPEARLIVLSAHASSFVCPPDLRPMLHAVVDKIDAYQHLGAEIEELRASAQEADLAASGCGEQAAQTQLRLTAREQEVLELVGKGFTTQQIADALGLSYYTAATHRRNLSLKLRQKGPALVRFAALHGLQLHAEMEANGEPGPLGENVGEGDVEGENAAGDGLQR